MWKRCKTKEQQWGSLHVPLHVRAQATAKLLVTTCLVIITVYSQKLHLSVELLPAEKLIDLPKDTSSNHGDEPLIHIIQSYGPFTYPPLVKLSASECAHHQNQWPRLLRKNFWDCFTLLSNAIYKFWWEGIGILLLPWKAEVKGHPMPTSSNIRILVVD